MKMNITKRTMIFYHMEIKMFLFKNYKQNKIKMNLTVSESSSVFHQKKNDVFLLSHGNKNVYLHENGYF